MGRLLRLTTVIALGAGLAIADQMGTGSVSSAGTNDPFLFGFSNTPGGTTVDLDVTDADGNSYTFTTDFDEINTGSTNSGWWSGTLANNNSNSNYIVEQGPGLDLNNYFTFNMGQFTVSAPILTAMLSIPTDFGFCFPEPGCETQNLPVTYYVGSVSISAATLADKNASPNALIYADLGTGNYGSVFVGSIAAYTNPLNVTLDATAIAGLNAVVNSEDYFSIGGTLAPTPTRIPEPVSWVLLATAALVLVPAIRRKARA